MAEGCWIDWQDESDELWGRRRVFGPTVLEAAVVGSLFVGEHVSLSAGPGAVATVAFADGSEVVLPPRRSLADVRADRVTRIRLRAA